MTNLFNFPPPPQKKPQILSSGAVFSHDHDKTHRYSLWRMWNLDKPAIMFIGLNPSRADQVNNDATINRCIIFANDLGYGRLHFLNLYSFRTPYVKRDKNFLAHLQKPGEKFEPLIENLHRAVGDEYKQHFVQCAKDSAKIVCCWGSWNFIDERANQVSQLIGVLNKTPYCFGKNNDGSPKHPLYLKATTKLMRYENKKS